LASSSNFFERWAAARADQPFKLALLPMVERFSRRTTDDFIHLDEIAGPVSSKIVWSEGNPIPEWFMVSRGGLHVSHFSATAPWRDVAPDPSVLARVPECPHKWGPAGAEWTGRPGYALVLGDVEVPGPVVRRRHPSHARDDWSLESQLRGADVVHIDNPHSGLILTARMMGKPVIAPRGGLFGPLLDNQTDEDTLRCLTWLEGFSVNVVDPRLGENLEARFGG
jgi:hypothetical protein